MTTAADSTTPAHGVSRRRVIQGAAWATPAILIATASPPAAASIAAKLEVEPGFTVTKSAVRHYEYTISGLALKHGSSAPVTGLTVTIMTDSNMALTGKEAPVVIGAGWKFALSASGVRALVFNYEGTLPALVATQALVVTLTRSNKGNSATTFTVLATGTSNGAAVSTTAGPITV